MVGVKLFAWSYTCVTSFLMLLFCYLFITRSVHAFLPSNELRQSPPVYPILYHMKLVLSILVFVKKSPINDNHYYSNLYIINCLRIMELAKIIQINLFCYRKSPAQPNDDWCGGNRNWTLLTPAILVCNTLHRCRPDLASECSVAVR